MFKKILTFLGGDPNKRAIQQAMEVVDRINHLEPEYEKLSDEALRAKTAEFRTRLNNGETLEEITPEAFAAVREASKRTLGLRHYDVQMIGGLTLTQGKIAEMRTGEGKTLVATLPLYLNAISGKGAHLITVNDYLARRDARWMAPIYQALGMTVGVLQMAARTENGRNAFLIDLEKTSPHEDQHQLRLVLRAEAYKADITYGTNSEFGFDYLRDNLTMRWEERVQRGHNYAIVDEVDNILIDEARTPLIISGPAQEDTEWYLKMAQVVRQLRPEDFEIDEKDRAVSLTEIGEVHVEEILGEPMRDPERPEDITPEQARMMGFLEQSLRAQFLFKRNKDYLVQAGKVVIVDEFTGRLMPGRRWSDGLHQAIEAKEGVKIEAENVTYATITIQNYFRMYEKLGGMSGTALTEAEEFWKIYKLDVLPIPTNLEYRVLRPNSTMIEVENKDEKGYRQTFYTYRDDPQKKPAFWRRKDFPDLVYRTQEAKLRAISMDIIRNHVRGQPQLVGTTSVEHSELLAHRLSAEPVRRLAQTVILRSAWFEKNNAEPGERSIPELQPLYEAIDRLDVANLRQMGRTLNVSLNPEELENLTRLEKELDLTPDLRPRLIKVLQGGVPNQVLNARKHDEEATIIARAGALGAVTIATNMAGRGVDIKLGGELDEEVLGDTNRVLVRAGYDAYNMTNEQRKEALEKMNSEDYGIYEEAVKSFLQYIEDMKQVRLLGGLHVVGSERHEARRIDNQLRGRAARQGDPGSSRFYLALEDDLMRLFGGQQVEGLLKRLNVDEYLPIESGIVGRLVEQSQERVEGSNFDVRKHLLEYDDVLNKQRNRIYEQRDRVFLKEDLSEDVAEMLKSELQERVPQALKDEEGPWKLLAYLEQIQPPILDFDDLVYPSFTLRVLINELRGELKGNPSGALLRGALLNLAGRALKAEREHLLSSMRTFLDKTGETLEQQQQERFDALDNFLENANEPGEDGLVRRPQELVDELGGVLHTSQLRLNMEQQRQLQENPKSLTAPLRQMIEDSLLATALSRVFITLERRLNESLDLKPNQFADQSWKEISNALLDLTENVLDQQYDRLLGSGGQIARDLDLLLDQLPEEELSDPILVKLLSLMTKGARKVFDRRTHRQSTVATTRINYYYLAAQVMSGQSPQNVALDILEHLQGAESTLRQVWGRAEWMQLAQGNFALGQIDEARQRRLYELLGEARYAALSSQPVIGLSPDQLSVEERDQIVNVLGWAPQNETYRYLLLSTISELWVDYLTRVEALRVSIGLEAYAQRDPLVQYKSKASEMFKELLGDIRMGVIGKMFLYRPRITAPTIERAEVEEADESAENEALADNKKKRRRH